MSIVVDRHGTQYEIDTEWGSLYVEVSAHKQEVVSISWDVVVEDEEEK
jgi:hypothetical protein